MCSPLLNMLAKSRLPDTRRCATSGFASRFPGTFKSMQAGVKEEENEGIERLQL